MMRTLLWVTAAALACALTVLVPHAPACDPSTAMAGLVTPCEPRP